MSQKMFRYLIDDNHLDYEEEDIQFIEQLVCGNLSQYVPRPSSQEGADTIIEQD
jgi:hypothetical protein